MTKNVDKKRQHTSRKVDKSRNLSVEIQQMSTNVDKSQKKKKNVEKK